MRKIKAYEDEITKETFFPITPNPKSKSNDFFCGSTTFHVGHFGMPLGSDEFLYVANFTSELVLSRVVPSPSVADPFKIFKIFLLTTSIYVFSENFMRLRLKLKDIFLCKVLINLSDSLFILYIINKDIYIVIYRATHLGAVSGTTDLT